MSQSPVEVIVDTVTIWYVSLVSCYMHIRRGHSPAESACGAMALRPLEDRPDSVQGPALDEAASMRCQVWVE